MTALDILRRGAPMLLWGSILAAALPASGATAEPHLFVVTGDLLRSDSAALDLDPPWTARVDLEPAGAQAIVRHFFGRHYVVSESADTIQVIDPATFDTILTFSAGAGSRPQDIALVDPGTAYVSRYERASLLKVDPRTGQTLGTIDLSSLADADGLPEMSMMALDRDRLFVQIQRLDRLRTGLPIRPSYLAVVDVTTDALVDADPEAAGVQGIALFGTVPMLKMHRDTAARRLFVLAPGMLLDDSGGIDEIDLDGLRSLGTFLPETESIGDLGAFVMTSPDRGYAVGHTDLLESSHLFEFTRADGRITSEIHLTFATVRGMAFDPVTGRLFFPDPDFSAPGIHVIDTSTNARLTRDPVSTGLPPRDPIVVRPHTPGEAVELRVSGFDPTTGDLSIAYRPACGSSDHNVVWGRLEDVAAYAYSGEACGIGAGGTFDRLNPGEGSFFFLVVGTDGVSTAGSYGRDSAGRERPENTIDPACAFQQDLGFTCDIW